MQPLLILAGGFGTRLKEVVSEVPKPLAPVCGQPFLRYVINNCISQGIKDIVLLLHYEATKIHSVLDDMSNNGFFHDVKVRTLIEENPLGTGGAILNAVETFNFDGSFMVMNADTWLGTGIKSISNMRSPTLAIVKVDDCGRYGSVEVKSGLVKEFSEKKISKHAGFINAGLYHFSLSDFKGFISGQSFSLESDLLPRLVESQTLKAISIKTNFIDIGVPDDYFKFCEWVEKGDVSEV